MYVFMRASTIHTRVLKAHHSKRRTRRTKARRAINIYRASIYLSIYIIYRYVSTVCIYVQEALAQLATLATCRAYWPHAGLSQEPACPKPVEGLVPRAGLSQACGRACPKRWVGCLSAVAWQPKNESRAHESKMNPVLMRGRGIVS